MEIRMKVPSVKPLLPVLLLTALLAGFMALDKTTLHWYVPDENTAVVERLQNSIDSTEGKAQSNAGEISTLKIDVSSLKTDVAIAKAGAEIWPGAIGRLATAVTINSLVNNLGGYQRSDSPTGKACRNWLLVGDGSITDCGFTRTE